jgi:hypothetical protein
MPTVSVTLSPTALRRALDLLESDGIDSLDDLVERLIVGASLEGAGVIGAARASETEPSPADLLAPIGEPGPLELAPTPETVAGRLPFLTNRLNPLKVACRALANAALAEGLWPYPNAFIGEAGLAARKLGIALRADDAAAGRKGLERRWVAYPVGESAEAAIPRFGFAFGAAWSPSGQLGGPLVMLGLVAAVAEAVTLTEAGWQLAALASPLFGEADAGGARLSNEERALLIGRLLAAPQEAELIADFLASVRAGKGHQPAVDRALADRRPEWSVDQASSERSALVGRLYELGALSVTGRGRGARIELLDIEDLESSKEQS